MKIFNITSRMALMGSAWTKPRVVTFSSSLSRTAHFGYVLRATAPVPVFRLIFWLWLHEPFGAGTFLPFENHPT